MIPGALWDDLGGSADSFIGKTIEVDGTPRRVYDRFISVSIMTATQLRIIR